MCSHDSRQPVLLLAFLILSGVIHAADETPGTGDSSPHVSKDPVELRRQRNARYVDVPVTTRVTQRFEMYDPRTPDELADLAEMGFTQVILDRPQLHEAATAAGLKVVLANWWTDKTEDEQIERGVDWAKKVAPHSLIGFSVMDEPGRNAPDTPFGFYIDLYKGLKPVFEKDFPGTRLEISHWGPMASWDDRYYDYFAYLYEAADVMRIMPYPDLYEAPLDDVFFMMQRSRRMMKIAETDLPLLVILQAWILPPHNKLPTIDELRVMAYQAMLSGAETISFFDYNVEVWQQTPGFEHGFRELMRELTAFSHKYRDYDVVSRIDDAGLFTSTLTDSTGLVTRVFINTQRAADGDFDPLEVRVTSHGSETRPCETVTSCCRCCRVCSPPIRPARTRRSKCRPPRLKWRCVSPR